MTGVGLDTVPVPTYGTDIDDQLGANFLSISWPLAAKATLTGYLHQAGHDRQRILQPGRVSARDVFRRDQRTQPRASRRRYSQRRCPQLRRRDRLSGLRPPLCRRRRVRLDVRSGCELRAIRDQWRTSTAPSTARAPLRLPSRMAMMPRPRSMSAGSSMSFPI